MKKLITILAVAIIAGNIVGYHYGKLGLDQLIPSVLGYFILWGIFMFMEFDAANDAANDVANDAEEQNMHENLDVQLKKASDNLQSGFSVNMRSVIVGGDFGVKKTSSVVDKLAGELGIHKVNGGTVSDIEHLAGDLKSFDLVIWAPNVNNEVEKIYPKKANGAVLICTKVLRKDRDFDDAIARIFKMNGNAVITIESGEKPFTFNLIDALGNVWCRTADLQELSNKIKELYNWTKSSMRTGSQSEVFLPEELHKTELGELCEIVKEVADTVENERGGRYFGNVSTRCGKMFPSYRLEHDIVLMSGRNVSKSRISSEDFVYTKMVDGNVLYHGEKKPSVDTPIQLSMYECYKNINFLIHGHAYIDGADSTEHYYPCGDMRELSAVKEKIGPEASSIILNLKNHGFIIGANNLVQLRKIVRENVFRHRRVGMEVADIQEKELEVSL